MSKIISGNTIGIQANEQEQLAQFARLIRNGEDIKCDSCGGLNFINIYRIRKISGLLSGTGRDIVVPVPVYACADCGHVNERFLKAINFDNEEETSPTQNLNETKTGEV